MKVKYIGFILIVCACDWVVTQLIPNDDENINLNSNDISNDEPPYDILSVGRFDEPNPTEPKSTPRTQNDDVDDKKDVETFNPDSRRKGYRYEKPEIPFEFDNQATNQEETFEGYNYPKPVKPAFEFDNQATNQDEVYEGYNYPKPERPFPFPPSTTEPEIKLPGATARLIIRN